MDLQISKPSFLLSRIQPDARELVQTSIAAGGTVLTAAGTEKLRQLGRIVDKAAESPDRMARMHVESYAPICIMKGQFLCAGKQASQEEKAANMAKLGFPSTTAFITRVAEAMHIRPRTLCTQLDATCFYICMFTKPEEDRIYVGVDTAAELWCRFKQADDDQITSTLNRLKQLRRRIGKQLSRAEVKKLLVSEKDPIQVEDTVMELETDATKCDNQVEDAVMETPPRLVETDATKCDNQMEDTVMETPPRLVETDATKVEDTVMGVETDATKVDVMESPLLQAETEGKEQAPLAAAELGQKSAVTANLAGQVQCTDGAHSKGAGDSAVAVTTTLQLEIAQLRQQLAQLQKASPPSPTTTCGGEANSKFAAMLKDFMVSHPDWSYGALGNVLAHHRTPNLDRTAVDLAIFLHVLSKLLPQEDTLSQVCHKVPTRLPADLPEKGKARLHDLIVRASMQYERRYIFWVGESEGWDAHKRAMVYLLGQLFGKYDRVPDLKVAVEEATDGLLNLAVWMLGCEAAWDDYVTHLLQSRAKGVLEFAASWVGCDEQARRQVVWDVRQWIEKPKPW